MRLLLTSDSVGGVWTYTVSLVGALSELGVECHILCLGPPPREDQWREVDRLGVDLIACEGALEWLARNESEIARASAIIRQTASDMAATTIHLHSPAYAAFALGRSTICVNHSCVATWWQVMRGSPLPADLLWRADLNARGLARSDETIAPTHAFAALMAQVYHLPSLPHVIQNGCAQQELPSTDDVGRFVFSAGRLWDEAKNYSALDRLSALLPQAITVAGALRSPFGNESSFAHLRHLGSCDFHAVQALLRRRPIYISAARFEPFGLSILEAASHGCPLILNDIESLRELWDGAAIFVDIERSADVARSLQDVQGNPDECAALGHAAFLRAQLYTETKTASSVLRLHESLVEEVAR